MAVEVRVPGALADLTGGVRSVSLDLPAGTLADLLDAIAAQHPALDQRLRGEDGQLRRFVAVYVDAVDVRTLQGTATPVPDGASVQLLPAVAGG